jgi:hypothetical protein
MPTRGEAALHAIKRAVNLTELIQPMIVRADPYTILRLPTCALSIFLFMKLYFSNDEYLKFNLIINIIFYVTFYMNKNRYKF